MRTSMRDAKEDGSPTGYSLESDGKDGDVEKVASRRRSTRSKSRKANSDQDDPFGMLGLASSSIFGICLVADTHGSQEATSREKALSIER